jgi:hypothetical protein
MRKGYEKGDFTGWEGSVLQNNEEQFAQEESREKRTEKSEQEKVFIRRF